MTSNCILFVECDTESGVDRTQHRIGTGAFPVSGDVVRSSRRDYITQMSRGLGVPHLSSYPYVQRFQHSFE